jgi:hypothetical protein
MDGKRFGIGLAAGLLLGLAIVTASGGLGSAPAIFGPASSPLYGGEAAATTTTNTVASALTTTVTQSSSTSGVPAYSVNPANSTTGSVSNAKTITSISSTTSPGQSSLNSLGSSEKSPNYSSRIVSITQQPLLSNTVIFVPVLAAFLLGAILYRASNRNKDRPDRSQG